MGIEQMHCYLCRDLPHIVPNVPFMQSSLSFTRHRSDTYIPWELVHESALGAVRRSCERASVVSSPEPVAGVEDFGPM